MTDDELEAIRKRVTTYRKTYPWKLDGQGKDFIAQDRDALLAEVFRLRALVGEIEWEYAGDHGDGSLCVAESLDWVLFNHDRSMAVRRRVSPWEPVPETGNERG